MLRDGNDGPEDPPIVGGCDASHVPPNAKSVAETAAPSIVAHYCHCRKDVFKSFLSEFPSGVAVGDFDDHYNNAWIKLLTSESFDWSRPAGPYLKTMVKRDHLDRCIRRSRVEFLPELPELPVQFLETDPELQGAIRCCIWHHLTARCRHVFMMRKLAWIEQPESPTVTSHDLEVKDFIDRWRGDCPTPYTEISRQLRITGTNARMAYSHVLAHLRECLVGFWL